MSLTEISIAPMMGYTDRHARYFLRLISSNSVVYTEMVTTGALLNGDIDKLLSFHVAEHPIVLQLGGNDPKALAQCAKIAQDYGYDEINLNVGCPSDRVKSGHFGASLMLQPKLVADCIASMQAVVDIPVTVKCRIGVDEMEDYHALENFVHQIADVGCCKFVVHARKAWLQGLSPKQNREIPPLRYELVHRLKQNNPELYIVINGGIKTLANVQQQLEKVDGVMIGREAYHNPFWLLNIDNLIFNNGRMTQNSRENIVEKMCEYIDKEMSQGAKLHTISRHMLGLFQGCVGAKVWRRYISENSHKVGADSRVIKQAFTALLEVQKIK